MKYGLDKITDARKFAYEAHSLAKYDGKNYSFHLASVVGVIEECLQEYDPVHEVKISLDLRADFSCFAYLHDVLEDCGFACSYNDLVKRYGMRVADMVYAATCEKGRTREERFNDKFYDTLRETEFGFFGKACDRIANMRYSKANGSTMRARYIMELPHFIERGLTDVNREVSEMEKELNRIVLTNLKEI